MKDQASGRARFGEPLAGAPAGAGPERSVRDVLVGAAGIEPATTCSQSRYATAALRPAGGDYRTEA